MIFVVLPGAFVTSLMPILTSSSRTRKSWMEAPVATPMSPSSSSMAAAMLACITRMRPSMPTKRLGAAAEVLELSLFRFAMSLYRKCCSPLIAAELLITARNSNRRAYQRVRLPSPAYRAYVDMVNLNGQANKLCECVMKDCARPDPEFLRRFPRYVT